jgi:hypothetical protein
MATSKKIGLAQGNNTSHIFPEFALMSREATQLQVLEAIKGIQINVGDIIVGDITVESSDTGTHTRLDTSNTTLSDINLYSGLISEGITQMNFITEDDISKLQTNDINVSSALAETNTKLDDTNTKLDAQTEILQELDTQNESLLEQAEFINTNLETANTHLETLDNFNYEVRDPLTPAIKDLKVYDKTLDDCLGINDNDVKYLRVRETKNPSGSFGNWLDNATILNGFSSPNFDCTALNRDSFLSYKDDNVGNTGSVAIFTGDGAIIGVLNPKPDPSNTYRFAYTQINLIPFTFINLQNWSGSDLTGVVACVYSG